MSQRSAPIYLDYHATTPVDPRVLSAMMPYFETRFGNAASRSHIFGWQAEEAVEIARKHVAELLDVDARSIFFTSGSTEGLNMLIKGTVEAKSYLGRHVILISTEHHAVLDVANYLQAKGFEITMLPVNPLGRIDLNVLNDHIKSSTILVAVMWANNETGVIHDMDAIGRLCKAKDVCLVSDATQAIGKIDVHPAEHNVDMLALSAHKFYGPKGIGAIYIDQQLKLKPTPLIHGGGHEHGMRSGTLNVPAIVGMGETAKLCKAEMGNDMKRIMRMRDAFEQSILNHVSETTINGYHSDRLPTVSNLCVRFTDSQSVMTKFRTRLAISSGSACSSADPSPSHVLLAMGLSEEDAKASYRFSLGRFTTLPEMETATQLFIQAVNEYRDQSPVWQMRRDGIDINGN